MPERLDGSRLIAALGAVILLVSLFLNWFKPELTAWTVFEFVDLLLAALAVATLLGVFAQAVPSAGEGPRLGGVAVDRPDRAPAGRRHAGQPSAAAVGRDLDTGVWVGLAGAILMALGGLLGFGRVLS